MGTLRPGQRKHHPRPLSSLATGLSFRSPTGTPREPQVGRGLLERSLEKSPVGAQGPCWGTKGVLQRWLAHPSPGGAAWTLLQTRRTGVSGPGGRGMRRRRRTRYPKPCDRRRVDSTVSAARGPRSGGPEASRCGPLLARGAQGGSDQPVTIMTLSSSSSNREESGCSGLTEEVAGQEGHRATQGGQDSTRVRCSRSPIPRTTGAQRGSEPCPCPGRVQAGGAAGGGPGSAQKATSLSGGPCWDPAGAAQGRAKPGQGRGQSQEGAGLWRASPPCVLALRPCPHVPMSPCPQPAPARPGSDTREEPCQGGNLATSGHRPS